MHEGAADPISCKKAMPPLLPMKREGGQLAKYLLAGCSQASLRRQTLSTRP